MTTRQLAALLFAIVAASAAGGLTAAPAVAGRVDTGRVDTTQGEAVYARCLGCHALTHDRTGPRHCGLFGRKAGSVADFSYSPAMQRSKIVWTSKTLDIFLKEPMRAVPGTIMGYDGVKDPAERAALIAYLRQANGSPACGIAP